MRIKQSVELLSHSGLETQISDEDIEGADGKEQLHAIVSWRPVLRKAFQGNAAIDLQIV